jgi:lipopolysaccharide transport system permease protein
MISDIKYSIHNWRLVHLMGVSALRTRYSRSKFGQAWLTLTNLFHIISIAIVWSLIWKIDIIKFLPYVGLGHLIYLFIAQLINESVGVFVADSRLYLNDKRPFLLSIFSHMYRNILIFLHNLPIIMALIYLNDTSKLHIDHIFIFGLALLLLFGFFSSYFLAVVCTRFRDLMQLVSLLFQIIFLITPVMWSLDFIDYNLRVFILINPFAAILEVLRNPLLGMSVNDFAIFSLLGWTLLSFFLALIAYYKMDKKIIFWI